MSISRDEIIRSITTNVNQRRDNNEFLTEQIKSDLDAIVFCPGQGGIQQFYNDYIQRHFLCNGKQFAKHFKLTDVEGLRDRIKDKAVENDIRDKIDRLFGDDVSDEIVGALSQYPAGLTQTILTFQASLRNASISLTSKSPTVNLDKRRDGIYLVSMVPEWQIIKTSPDGKATDVLGDISAPVTTTFKLVSRRNWHTNEMLYGFQLESIVTPNDTLLSLLRGDRAPLFTYLAKVDAETAKKADEDWEHVESPPKADPRLFASSASKVKSDDVKKREREALASPTKSMSSSTTSISSLGSTSSQDQTPRAKTPKPPR